MILTAIIRSKISQSTIESVCRILHNRNKAINEISVVKELKLIMQARGILGIEYIYDQDVENPPYKNLEEDVARLCKILGIKTSDEQN